MLAWATPTDPTIKITVDPSNPTPTIITLNPNSGQYILRLCVGTPVRLESISTGTGTLTFQWVNLGDNSVIANSNIFTGTLPEGEYVSRVTDSQSTITSTTSVLVCLDSAPPLNPTLAISGATSICTAGGGGDITLTAGASPSGTSAFCADPGFTYEWYKDNVLIAGAVNKTFIITNSTGNEGSYTARIYNKCGFVSASTTLTTSATAPLNAEITSNDGTNSFCPGGSLTLQANVVGQANRLEWYKDDVLLAGIIANTLTVTVGGNYKLIAVNGCGQVTSPVFTVLQNTSPTSVDLLGGGDFCGQTVFDVNIQGGTPEKVEYFRGDELVKTLLFPFPDGTGYITDISATYKVKVSNKCGTIESLPVTATAIAPITFARISPNGPPSLSSTCNPPRTEAVLSIDTDGENILFTEWYDEFDSAISFDNTLTVDNNTIPLGKYYAIIYNTCGTMNTDTVHVVEVNTGVPTNLILNAEGGNNSCSGLKKLLCNDFGDGTLYEWYKDNVKITGTVKPYLSVTDIGIGTYKVQASNACGMSDFSNEITLNINFTPDILEIDTPAGTITCDAPSSLLPLNLRSTPQSGVVYEWYKDGQPFSTGISIIAQESGDYQLVAGNSCGTKNSDIIAVRYLTTPTINNVNLAYNPCETPLVMSVQTPADFLTYRWFKIDGVTNPQVASTPTFQPTEAGTYYVAVRNDCLPLGQWINAEPATITLGGGGSLPSPTVISQPMAGIDRICPETTLILKAQTNNSINLGYRWFKGSQLLVGSNQDTIQVRESGLYAVEVFDLNNNDNCSRVSAPYSIFVRPAPTLLLTFNGELTFCEGDSVRLNANAQITPTQYTWYKDNQLLTTGKIVNAKTSGVYVLEATYNAGTLGFPCVYTAKREVVLFTLPAPVPQIIIDGGILQTAEPARTYQWNYNGIPILDETQRTYFPLDSGRYSVTITNELGCSGTSAEVMREGIYLGETEPLQILPNPNNGSFKVVAVAEQPVVLSLYNMLGQVIWTEVTVPKQNSITGYGSIEVGSLGKGVYVLRATIDGRFVAKRVIVK
jgi:hypothetical protein